MKKTIKKSLIILSSLLITSGLFACGGNSSSESSSESKNRIQNIDFMSFNIRTQTDSDTNKKNWSYRGEYVIDYILNSGMDFLCLQEVRQVQYEDLRTGLQTKYSVLYYARESGSNPEGLAICYSKDYELVEETMFWLSETPDKMSLGWGASYYRICVNALLKNKETGQYFNVFNVHLDNDSENARNNGLSLVLEKVMDSDYPVIVAGDFNTTNDSYCYTLISDYLYDCQQDAVETEEGMTIQNWGEEVTYEKSIDFCFVSEELEPKVFDIRQDFIEEGVYYSDHFAISVELELEYRIVE